jgi:hypothetical protein
MLEGPDANVLLVVHEAEGRFIFKHHVAIRRFTYAAGALAFALPSAPAASSG